MRAGINVDRDHIRPLLEIVLTCRRELMLIILGPAMEIIDTTKHERGFPLCSGSRVGCSLCDPTAAQPPLFSYCNAIHRHADQSKRGKNLERANSHAAAGGGI